ncbi:MAG: efflux RND transporter permease subunit [Gammaproteobacteria bacterium]|nr:efflux RND transporter permease subunit [Gammaproteobacteria bacterium]
MFGIRFSINNPLLVNLSLIIVIVIGVIAWYSLPQEIFPAIELDMISINTTYEGASPAEVEQQVSLPIEEEFEDSQDIDYISSTSSEGNSSVYIKLKPGSDVDDFMAYARTLLDSVGDLPELADKPELLRLRTRFPVITLTLYGGISHAEMYRLAEDVRHQMQQIPGVANVSMAGDRQWELWVVVDPHELAALNISLDRIMLSLRNNLRDQPGGSIKSSEGDIRLRGKGVTPEPAFIEDIVLLTNANGGQLKLRDIAKVSRRFEEAQTYARFNGKPSVNLIVTKTSEASTIEVSRRVHELREELKRSLPESVMIGLHTDMSTYVKTRLNVVKSSGLIGLVLVLLSLYLLLNFRIALITAFGIPVSFLFAIILLYYFDYSINMVSLFAFLIVLGMIVDDAIIVTENVYRHIEMGQDNIQAAITGSNEVFWPVVVSTLTTIAAFLPMFSIGSTLGEFIKVIPVVVCCALLGSLLEAFVVLPSHAAHFLKRQKRRSWINWKLLLDRYGEILRWSVTNRYTVSTLSVAILIVALAYAYTRLPYEQFGDVEIGQFFVNIEAPNTYSLEDSLALSKKLESVVFDTIREDELQTLLTNVGYSIIDPHRSKTGSNIIQLIIDLKKTVADGFIDKWIAPIVSLDFSNHGTRVRSTADIINAIRQEFQQFSGIKRMSILRPQGGPAGDDIEIGIVSSDFNVMQTKADEIRDYLRRMPGVKDVQHDQEPGKLEYKYKLNDRGKQLGLSQSQLADVVRTGFLGNEIVHVTSNDKRIPVRLIYPESIRQQSSSLTELPIVLADGRTVYLGDVAEISIGRGLNQIRRRDNRRMAKITAEIDSDITTPLVVARQISEKFTPDTVNAGYSLLFLGEKKDADEAFSGMYDALAISIIIIFFMLTALFKSLLDPIVVMVVIPFGMIGVIIGHAIFAYNLQFLSIVGMLALSGIIVNDSLILIDFIKKKRAEGLDRIHAVVEACKVRARPIILTTITTFLGVSPLIFFSTGQTKFLAPMAVSLGFGLVFATVLILLALPCFYLIADDFRLRFYRLFAKVRTEDKQSIASR